MGAQLLDFIKKKLKLRNLMGDPLHNISRVAFHNQLGPEGKKQMRNTTESLFTSVFHIYNLRKMSITTATTTTN